MTLQNLHRRRRHRAVRIFAMADEPKEFRTTKGKAVVLGEFLNMPSDCSSNPQSLTATPRSHGVIVMQIVLANVRATGSCPARKIPVIALIYSPAPDFVGTDSVQIEAQSSHQLRWLDRIFHFTESPCAAPVHMVGSGDRAAVIRRFDTGHRNALLRDPGVRVCAGRDRARTSLLGISCCAAGRAIH